MKILIIQTAFIGDVILTLPVAQVIKREMPDALVDFLCIPSTAPILSNNPYLNDVLIYDKRRSGLKGLLRIAREIKKKKYDVIISPHRSFRSSLITFLSGCKNSIAFDKSDMRWVYKWTVEYKQEQHEIQRNLGLLAEVVGINEHRIVRPELFPGEGARERIGAILDEAGVSGRFVCVAPGSIWYTKRYPKERYRWVVEMLTAKNINIFIVGGKDDEELGNYLAVNEKVVNTAGKLSLLESAELIRRASLLITNDSAPMHIANAMGTDVIAIFGATVPDFGFFPYGENDVIVETNGLACRPCSIHGGNKCPIGTFECMMRIEKKDIVKKAEEFI
ncbi:MAG: glycosyltransferase family 9 protein [Ignavibacteriae bacterium]|nr:glycosyltransferase family 9 protein [Ignavibacteriota bacterium]MCB9243432.1 glycosyltransferase family 9 protein [Ignavibacteriales bacterium]